jgi:hypothetical protein
VARRNRSDLEVDHRARVVAPVGAADRRHLVVDPGVGRRAPEVVRRVVVVVPTVGRRRLVGLVVVRRVVVVVPTVGRRRLVGLVGARPVAVVLLHLVGLAEVRPGLVVVRRDAVVHRLLAVRPGRPLQETLRDLRACCSRPAWPRRHRRRSPC